MMRRAYLLPLFLLCAFPSPGDAFDWESKLQRTLRLLRSPSPSERATAAARLAGFELSAVRRYVLEGLHDDSPRVQQAAAETAAHLRLQEATPVLLSWLSHWDESLRLCAAERIGRIGGRAVTLRLVRALADPEPKIRLAVLRSLAETRDKRALFALIARLEDVRSDVRKLAIQVLGRLGDGRAVLPLLARLNDASSAVRVAALGALGALKDRRAAKSILRMLRDREPTVVEATIITLGALRADSATPALIELFRHGGYRHRDSAARSLVAIGTRRAMGAVLGVLGNASLGAVAFSALSEAPQQDARYISELLQDPQTPRAVVIAALQIAARAKIREIVEGIIEQFRLGRLPRREALVALGAIGDPRAMRFLLRIATDAEPELQLAALEALEGMIDGRGVGTLLVCLRSGAPDVRMAAIALLSRLQPAFAASALVSHLGRKDLAQDEIRATIRALALSAAPAASTTLIAALKSDDPTLRRFAASGIAKLKATPALVSGLLRVADQLPKAQRKSALFALAALNGNTYHEASARLLERQIAGDAAQVAPWALGMLGVMDHTSVARRLLEIARKPADNAAARLQAVAGLGHQRRSAAVVAPILVQLARGDVPSVAAAAAWSIGRIGHLAALEALAKRVESSKGALRINISAALATTRDPRYRPLLLRLLKDTDGYVRANAALGLAWQPSTGLPDGLSWERLGREDNTSWVRYNAFRALWRQHDALTAGRAPALKKLATMIARDRDARVRLLATRLSPSGLPSPSIARGWVALAVRDSQDRPLRQGEFVLITPAGLARVCRTDGDGDYFDYGLSAGDLYVEKSAEKGDME